MRSILFFLFILFSTNAIAENTFLDSLNKKVEVKKSTRWTLADWFATKEKVRLMDLWLAANTSSKLFEFYISADRTNYEIKNLTSLLVSEGTRSNYSFGAFISIIGLNLESGTDEKDKFSRGLLILRLLGASEQSTRLNVFYGLQNVNSDLFTETYNVAFWGGSLRIYLLSFFGIYGRYRSFSSIELPNKVLLKTTDVEYGAFIDIGPLQIYGHLQEITDEFSSSSDTKKSGLKLGARLYF